MSIVKSYSFPDGEIRGDMFYIKHNTSCFTLIDCFLKECNNRNNRKEEIIQEVCAESKDRICRFVSTHPDSDHIAGIEDLDKVWPIVNFYAVRNSIPSDSTNPCRKKYLELLKSDKCFDISRGILRKWLNIGDSKVGSSGIQFHWPDLNNAMFKETLSKVKEEKDTNNICPIFTYQIKGGATYMWMGDLETEMQQEFYDCYKDSIPKVDVLFQPHHGRKSASVPPDLLKALQPKIIVIGNAPNDHIDYGDSDITITQNTAGDILFVNQENRVHVFTQNKINNLPYILEHKSALDILSDLIICGYPKNMIYAGTLYI